jgi:hypothetical protein
MTIDQMSFTVMIQLHPWDLLSMLVGNSQMTTQSMGVGLYPSLMGTFNFVVPISYINSVPTCSDQPILSVPTSQVCQFCTSYFEDPWILPSPLDLVEGLEHARMAMPLSATKIAYQAIQCAIHRH